MMWKAAIARWGLLIALPVLALLAGCTSENPRVEQNLTSVDATVVDRGVESSVAAASQPATGRGPNPRFYEIGERLDEGGSFYLYADLKDMLNGFIDQMGVMMGSDPNAAQFFPPLRQLVSGLGLTGIHDIGMSTMPEENGLYRSKMFIHMPEGIRGLPALLGTSPGPVPLIQFAPADALLFSSTEFHFGEVLGMLRQVVGEVGGPQALQSVEQGLMMANMQLGVNIEQMLQSIDDRVGLILDQDESAPTADENVPPLRVALVFAVRDAALFETLSHHIKLREMAAGPEERQGEWRLLPLVAPEMPLPLAPVLALGEGHLVLTSNRGLLEQMLTTREGENLTTNADFRRLGEGLPSEGNALTYVSPRLLAMLGEIGDRMEEDGASEMILWKHMLTGRQTDGIYSIRCNEARGIYTVSRSPMGGHQAMGVTLLAPTAILAAIAVPNFLEAQTRSKVARSQADLRTLAVALESYFVDTNAYPAWEVNPELNAHGPFIDESPVLASQPTFRMREPQSKVMTLTTPIAYLPQLPADPFAPADGATYSYYADHESSGWIVWSPGPGGEYELTVENIAQIYRPAARVPSRELIELTYDPTNGTISAGDIWRVK